MAEDGAAAGRTWGAPTPERIGRSLPAGGLKVVEPAAPEGSEAKIVWFDVDHVVHCLPLAGGTRRPQYTSGALRQTNREACVEGSARGAHPHEAGD